MTSPKRPSGRAAAIAVALLVTLGACGDTEDEPTDPAGQPSAPLTSDAPVDPETAAGTECSEVIPASVIQALGWSPESPAVQDRGGCAWSGDQGNVVVVERAETYNDECERLTGVAPPTTFRSEVAQDVRGCGYVRDDELGLSEWVLDVDGRVISLSVAALTPTSSEQTRAALLALTPTAPDVSVS